MRSFAAVIALLSIAPTVQTVQPSEVPLETLVRAAAEAEKDARAALDVLAKNWRSSYAAILLELAEMHRPARRAPQPVGDVFPRSTRGSSSGPDFNADPPFADDALPAEARARSPVRDRLMRFLEAQTGKRFGHDFARWHEWIWSLPYEPHSDYPLFKGFLYANIDPLMREFFPAGVRTLIRLDEVRWGGVSVNGIPPLRYPKHIPAKAASYLKDDHIVFGMTLIGEARAYPKRILGWHELAWDRLGGIEITVVYCTLCGTVIPYESVIGGQLRRLGTSGLLYRSNKLMFDEATRSLWSTLEGKPVVGPLVGSGLQLRPHPAVTTTWGEWRRTHPDTTVLALETGHQRDYSEGAAYRDYFGTDRLMFTVPKLDTRLRNKAEVLVMQVESAHSRLMVPVAIASDFLKNRPVFQTEVAGRQLVVVTTRAGANRAYDAGTHRFLQKRGDASLVDDQGRHWQITEDALIADRLDVPPRLRLAAQRAFWFGWQAQFPDTVLIK